MRSARRGINLGADARTDNPTVAVDEIAIDAGTMVGIFFHDGETTAGRGVSGFAGRDRAIGHNLLADH